MPGMKAVLLLCALVCGLAGAQAKPKPDFSAARAVLEKAVRDHACPGATVCVGTEDKVLWSDAVGYMDYTSGTPVTRKTIYDLASCSKVTGTTSVFMRLRALGKIRTDDPVEQYLPDFVAALADPKEQAKRRSLRVEDLLTHSAAIVGWKPFYKEVNSYREMIARIFQTPLDGQVGKQYRYSDLGMMLLGEIASRAGGKPLPELEQELVFRPLKMKNTLRNPPAKLWNRIPPTELLPGTTNFVHGVVHDENSRAAEGITGHAGVFSTAEDLAKLATELLKGEDGRSKLFPKEVVEEFVRPRHIGANTTHGLGWDTATGSTPDGKPTRQIGHTGFTGTSIRIDLDRKFYVILLTNRVHPTRDNDKLGRVRRDLLAAVTAALE